MNNNIAAIVVTFNRKDLLIECINCLLKQKPVIPDIIIIDNHSTDGTYETLNEYIENKRIIYCDTGANLGGAGGFSFGIKFATEKGYNYIWIMDDDCMPQSDALEELLLANNELNGEYGFLSSKVLWKDGNICKMNIQRRTLTKNIENFNLHIQPVVMASFVSMFLPTSIVKEVGLPIKEFFIWTDDWEYTRRISKKYPCYAVFDSIVVHKSKSNIGANIATENADRLDRFDYLYRNDVFLYKREGIKGILYELFRLAAHCSRVMIRSSDNRMRRIKKIIYGTREGIHFNPKIEYIVQKETNTSNGYKKD